MSVQRCDFCERSVDTDFETMDTVKEGEKVRCEGCSVEQVEKIRAVLPRKRLERIKNTTEAEMVSGTAEDRMLATVDFVESQLDWTEHLSYLDLESLIEEAAEQ